MKQINYWGNKNIISKQLLSIRSKKKLSQSDLAAKMQILNINLDQQMISKIEKNQRQVTDYELVGLARCLDIDVSELIINFDKI